jgi:hypothetical protein
MVVTWVSFLPCWLVLVTWLAVERAWALHKTGYYFQARIRELEVRLAKLEARD